MFVSRAMIVTAAIAFAAPQAKAEKIEPLEFFEGRTETSGTIKLAFRKSFKSRSLGTGRINSDGTLTLVQKVEEDGKPVRERRWKIRQAGPGRFSGTMSEATGPVTIDEVGGRYRFRFKMKGGVSVEQWVSPLPGGKSAKNTITIRKLGVTVGSGAGIIRKLGN